MLVQMANATMFTTYVVYYVTGLHLNPFQLLMVGTVLELVYFFAEGPTGAWADTFGRKRSIVIGAMILGCSYIFEGLLPVVFSIAALFVGLLLAEGVRAIGEAFFSGAMQAWIADEVEQKELGQLLLRTASMERAASIVGILLSVFVTSFHLNLGYVCGGVMYLCLGLFLFFSVRETGFQPEAQGVDGGVGQVANTLLQGIRTIRRIPVLWGLLLVSLFVGVASEGIDRLWGAHFITDIGFPAFGHWHPVVWFGILAVLANAAGAIAAGMSSRYLDTEAPDRMTRILTLITLLRIGLIGLFAFASRFSVAIVAYLAITVTATLFQTLFEVWKMQNIPSPVRATVMSMLGQMDALGQSCGGPVIGMIGSRYTIRTALVAAALLLSPTLGAYAWFKRLRLR